MTSGVRYESSSKPCNGFDWVGLHWRCRSARSLKWMATRTCWLSEMDGIASGRCPQEYVTLLLLFCSLYLGSAVFWAASFFNWIQEFFTHMGAFSLGRRVFQTQITRRDSQHSNCIVQFGIKRDSARTLQVKVLVGTR